MCLLPCDAHGPFQFRCDLMQRRNIFRFVPDPSAAEDEILFPAWAKTLRAPSVRNRHAVCEWNVMTIQFAHHVERWSYHQVRGMQPLRHALPISEIFLGN